MRVIALLSLVATAAGFVVPAVPLRRVAAVGSPAASLPLAPVLQSTRAVAATRATTPSMGLFGLGWAEIGVIGVVALFIVGPDKLVPLAKDLGKSASSLKEVTDSFAEGMSEANAGLTDKPADADALKSAQAGPTITVKEEQAESSPPPASG